MFHDSTKKSWKYPQVPTISRKDRNPSLNGVSWVFSMRCRRMSSLQGSPLTFIADKQMSV